MKCRSALTVVFVLMISFFSLAQAQDHQIPGFYKAKIYYCDWDISSYINWGPKQVRGAANAVITTEGSQMAPLLQLLELSKVVEKAPDKGNARVVFDLYKADGTVTTYYADMFRLYNSDGSLNRRIDENFRKKLGDYFKGIF